LALRRFDRPETPTTDASAAIAQLPENRADAAKRDRNSGRR